MPKSDQRSTRLSTRSTTCWQVSRSRSSDFYVSESSLSQNSAKPKLSASYHKVGIRRHSFLPASCQKTPMTESTHQHHRVPSAVGWNSLHQQYFTIDVRLQLSNIQSVVDVSVRRCYSDHRICMFYTVSNCYFERIPLSESLSIHEHCLSVRIPYSSWQEGHQSFG